jgi:hypothetical protein
VTYVKNWLPYFKLAVSEVGHARIRFHTQNPFGELAYVSPMVSSVNTEPAISSGLRVGFGVGGILVGVAVGGGFVGVAVGSGEAGEVLGLNFVGVGLDVFTTGPQAARNNAINIMEIMLNFII